MIRRNISFYERKKRNYYKNVNFARKEQFILLESSCFELFGDEKYGFLLIQKVDVRLYFLQHEIPCFFEYGIVLVLDFSEIGNAITFWSKKFMESWYFLDIFEILMIFQDLRNMVFCAVKHFWYNSKHYFISCFFIKYLQISIILLVSIIL